jgi:hypothetical protein
MARAKKGRTRSTEKQVAISGQPFVADGNVVHGTPSDTERASKRRGAYAASSVIHRGTANEMKVQMSDEVEHVCLCGCGQTPSQADSLFMPGHDSKVRAMGKAILEGRLDKAKVYRPALEYLQNGGMLENGNGGA